MAEIEISFEDAAFGCEREITFQRIEPCSTCHGTGAKEGSKPETCTYCQGRGTVRVQQNFMGMAMQSEQRCPEVRRQRHHHQRPVPDLRCKGKGKVRRNKTIRVNVPAGIDDEQSFRVRDEGNAGSNGGPNGDLLVTVHVRNHSIFTRDGANVHCQMPISFTQAALGATIEVPTLDGKVRYNIPEGTQTGTVFRLRGRGHPLSAIRPAATSSSPSSSRRQRSLTKEQKELLRKLEDATGEASQPKRSQERFFRQTEGRITSWS